MAPTRSSRAAGLLPGIGFVLRNIPQLHDDALGAIKRLALVKRLQRRIAVDKHGHRPAGRLANPEHVIEKIPAGVAQVHDDHVRRQIADPAHHALHAGNDRHLPVSGRAQAIFNDGGARQILVNDQAGL